MVSCHLINLNHTDICPSGIYLAEILGAHMGGSRRHGRGSTTSGSREGVLLSAGEGTWEELRPLRLGLNFMALILIKILALVWSPQDSLLTLQSVVCPVGSHKPWNRDLPKRGDLDQGATGMAIQPLIYLDYEPQPKVGSFSGSYIKRGSGHWSLSWVAGALLGQGLNFTVVPLSRVKSKKNECHRCISIH